jgi:hypothetical protein
MRLLLNKKYIWVVTTIVLAIGYIIGCTKNDQVLNVAQTNTSTDLLSIKTSTPPTIDGVIDAGWSSATKLNIVPTVPDPGNGLFTGYIGQQYPATLRSMYDNTNIYFLLEVQDGTPSTNVSTWYFDPAQNVTGKTGWLKEPSSKTFDANGVVTREGWGEDKFAMLWNIDYSTPKFLTQTCYASCHIFTPYTDYSVTPAVSKSNANSGNHYTNGASEKIDMWWGRLGFISKDASLNQLDDNYQDWAGGPGVTNLVGGSGNGRHVDGIVVSGANTTWPFAPTYTTSPTQGEVNNSQSLKLDGTGASVNVPIWVIPGSTTNFILIADTTSGKAKKVTGVSSTGVLNLNDGSTIDPVANKEYQRPSNSASGATAAKAIAGFIAVPLIGGRADITCSAVYSGTGWIIEYKRALKTSDALKQDVDFSSLQDQQFGLAVWNMSNNQHGIQPNLLLKFQK